VGKKKLQNDKVGVTCRECKKKCLGDSKLGGKKKEGTGICAKENDTIKGRPRKVEQTENDDFRGE